MGARGFVALAVGAAAACALGGCASGRIESGVYHSSKGYRVAIPGPEWTVREGGRADLELRHRASAAGMGIIIRGGVARGVPESWEGRYYMVDTDTMKDYWEQAKLDDLLDGVSRMEYMLRFTLSLPDLDTTIVGTRSVDHLKDNLAYAAKGPLPDDVLSDAKARLTAAGAKPA